MHAAKQEPTVILFSLSHAVYMSCFIVLTLPIMQKERVGVAVETISIVREIVGITCIHIWRETCISALKGFCQSLRAFFNWMQPICLLPYNLVVIHSLLTPGRSFLKAAYMFFQTSLLNPLTLVLAMTSLDERWPLFQFGCHRLWPQGASLFFKI